MTNEFLTIDSQDIDFDRLKKYIGHNDPVKLSEAALQRVVDCRNYLDKKMEEPGKLIYGINTGFGYLQNIPIDHTQIEQLQYNLLVSHACGMGDEVPPAIVKLMLMLKVKSLSYGNSGVHLDTVNRLLEMHNNDMLPVIYTQGSLGASGDLAPLSHLSLPLLGLGQVWYNGTKHSSAEIIQRLNWKPLNLRSKEGLALINGTQFMSAYGLWCLVQAERLIDTANMVAAMSIDAFNCTTEPFHPSIHAIRNHRGQQDTAGQILKLLHGSAIAASQQKQVQDPYSFRCIPQVHGATTDTFDYVLQVFLKEINSVTDNPNIFPEDDLVLSGGNFHGQPLALALDFLCIAMSELANISERRIYQLISGQRGLPLFLVKNPGLHSGFMIPQYTAAGIVSENKQLCTPASIDSISSSNNQEDHVSMGANAATKCYRLMQNVERVIAIELLTAAQALEFRRPQLSAERIEKLHSDFRREVLFNHEDRVMHDDMMNAVKFIRSYNFEE